MLATPVNPVHTISESQSQATEATAASITDRRGPPRARADGTPARAAATHAARRITAVLADEGIEAATSAEDEEVEETPRAHETSEDGGLSSDSCVYFNTGEPFVLFYLSTIKYYLIKLTEIKT